MKCFVVYLDFGPYENYSEPLGVFRTEELARTAVTGAQYASAFEIRELEIDAPLLDLR